MARLSSERTHSNQPSDGTRHRRWANGLAKALDVASVSARALIMRAPTLTSLAHGGTRPQRTRLSTRPPADAELHRRISWLSPRDAAELVRAGVEADLLPGVEGFVVANGVSANRHNVAELEQTRRAIGYVPVDDAWDETA